MKTLLNFKLIVLSLIFIITSCNKENNGQHPNLSYEDFEQIIPYIHVNGIYYALDATSAKNDGVPDYLIEEAEKSIQETNDYLDKEIKTFKNDEGNIGSYQISLTDFREKKSFSQDATNSELLNHSIVLSNEKRHHRNYSEATPYNNIDTLYIGDVEQFKR
ncbi:hypothetical protein GO491_00475 [Flavobacteriaceae bacterium Ap0902]|nr:hypothetical protein [Flavobacteriaceae bacterium Ap0902]